MSTILTNINNNICILTINRPDHYNALNEEVLKELALCHEMGEA